MPGKNARSKEEMVVCRVSGYVDREGNQKTMKRCSYKRHLIIVHPTENASDSRGVCEKNSPELRKCWRAKTAGFEEREWRRTRDRERAQPGQEFQVRIIIKYFHSGRLNICRLKEPDFIPLFSLKCLCFVGFPI